MCLLLGGATYVALRPTVALGGWRALPRVQRGAAPLIGCYIWELYKTTILALCPSPYKTHSLCNAASSFLNDEACVVYTFHLDKCTHSTWISEIRSRPHQ